MARIQFVLKARDVLYAGEKADIQDGKKQYLSSGLFNSANLVRAMLEEMGHATEISHAIDNNDIDRLVTKFRPDICVIEAFWVVPEKFAILAKLHPKITWIIRNHSAVPFLANEGSAMDWSMRYMDYPNVILACNDARTNAEMQEVISVYKPDWSVEDISKRVFLLSNYYPATYHPRDPLPPSDTINISCFGAVRPLKNHLSQAIAAIRYAKKHNKHLRFHINGTRIEMKGEPIVNNLRKTFGLLPYELVEHDWMPHDEFCAVLRQMDVSMQVSYTETFNIVSADAVVNGVPVISGPDILWSDPMFQADPNETSSMVQALERTFTCIAQNTYWQGNVEGIRKFSENSKIVWDNHIRTLTDGSGQ